MDRGKLVSEMTIGELEELLSELIKKLPSYPSYPSYPCPVVPQPVWYGPQPNQPAYEVWCDTKTTMKERK